MCLASTSKMDLFESGLDAVTGLWSGPAVLLRSYGMDSDQTRPDWTEHRTCLPGPAGSRYISLIANLTFLNLWNRKTNLVSTTNIRFRLQCNQLQSSAREEPNFARIQYCLWISLCWRAFHFFLIKSFVWKTANNFMFTVSAFQTLHNHSHGLTSGLLGGLWCFWLKRRHFPAGNVCADFEAWQDVSSRCKTNQFNADESTRCLEVFEP